MKELLIQQTAACQERFLHNPNVDIPLYQGYSLLTIPLVESEITSRHSVPGSLSGVLQFSISDANYALFKSSPIHREVLNQLCDTIGIKLSQL